MKGEKRNRMREDALRWSQLLEATREAALDFITKLPEHPAGQAAKKFPPLRSLELEEEGLGAEGALTFFRHRHESRLSGSAGPRYLGFVTGGSTPAALAGDWLVSAYDQNLSNDGDSGASFVEREALNLLRNLFGLSDRFEGAFVSGATLANAVSLATARQWVGARLKVDLSEEGLFSIPRIPVFAAAPHASLYKALSILGMGRTCVELIPALPGREAINPIALETRLKALKGSPAVVVASAGTVNSGDFDDLEALGVLCRRHGAWLHVDGAFGLFAACDPKRAPRLQGLERADSIATDAHKWLNVPYDSGIVFTRHLALQEHVFKAVAAYLGAGSDLLHRTPENSRRFRALPAWMTLMAYGKGGYRALVHRSCEQAQKLGAWIQGSERFELLAPVRLNIVCFALKQNDAKQDDAKQRDHVLSFLLSDGRLRLTQTQFNGKPALRAAFVNWSTTEEDVDLAIAALGSAANEVAP
jgi:glutamate/tyrosine decarboxylase-like PLP-dependent enzyme